MKITPEHPKARFCTVIFNGFDVTHFTQSADDVEGVVELINHRTKIGPLPEGILKHSKTQILNEEKDQWDRTFRYTLQGEVTISLPLESQVPA